MKFMSRGSIPARLACFPRIAAGLRVCDGRAEAGSRRALGPPRSRPAWARAALLACVLVLALAAPALAAPGDFDASFANGGKLRVSFPGQPDARAHAVALQPDGKIVAAGQAGDYGAASVLPWWVVTRLHPNGSLDDSFGSAGKEGIRGSSTSSLADAALQPDGKIVLVGTASTPDMLAVRLEQDGSFDTPFPGRAGFPEGDERGEEVAVQPDGKIVVAGTAAGRGILVARLNSDGSLDTSFGDTATPGHAFIGRNASDDTTALALQPDGQIVVAALTPGPLGQSDFLIERLPANGRSGTGRFQRTIDFGAADIPHALSLQPDGKIVVAGSNTAGPLPIARLTPDGSLDDSFGDGGKRLLQLGADGSAAALDLALQPDGKVVLAGLDFTPATSRDHFVARLNSNGSPDGSFAAGGWRQFDLGGPDQALAVALQPDGKIVLAGFAGREFTVVRLEGDGSVVPDGAVVPDGSVVPPPGAPLGPPPPAGLRPAACANERRGTGAADVLNGTSLGDRLLGLAGNDTLNGLQGDDCLLGGAGNDKLTGASGADTLSGDAGRDKLSGGPGNDRLSGGSGNDTLAGGQGENRLSGGSGDDTLNSADGKRETVSCGGGRDVVRADRADRLSGCERVLRLR